MENWKIGIRKSRASIKIERMRNMSKRRSRGLLNKKGSQEKNFEPKKILRGRRE